MSLQVWLPLNGNLNNQGLDPAVFTKTNNIWGDGIIGEKALLTQNGTSLIMVEGLKNKTNFSIAYWLKVDSSLTFSNYQDIWQLEYYIPSLHAAGVIRDEHNNTPGQHSVILCKDPNYSNNTNSYYGMTSTSIPDTWIHCVLVKRNDKTDHYINGIKKSTVNNSVYESSMGYLTGNVKIGNTTCGAYLNDFRIYDHALSKKEIEEISKGLVLHYPLNNHYLAENILANSSGYEGIQNWSGLISSEEENGQQYFKIQRTDTTSTSKTFIAQNYNSSLPLKNLIDNCQAGDTFTISGWYKVPSNETQDVACNVFIRWYSQDNSIQVDRGFSTSKNVKDSWIRFENTFTVPDNVSETTKVQFIFAFSQGLATIYFKNLKVELGNKATQWCPAKIDSLYSTLGYNNNIIYDTSGYCNNGTIVGSLNAVASSPRYDYCIEHLDSCADYIYRPHLSFLGNSGFTFSCWINPSSYSRTNGGTTAVGNQYILSQGRDYLPSGTDHTYGASLIMNNGKIYFVCGSGSLYSNTTVSIGEWAHVVGVWTGTQKKIYINGVLKNSENDNRIDWSETSNRLAIGKMAYGSSSTTYHFPFVGKISDIRIYATALTDNQIKELYNTSMGIDSSGNVYARELVEE